MWVNVSPRQIADLHFAELVAELTANHGVPALLLGLEIAEHAVRDVVTTENVLAALHELGVAGVDGKSRRCHPARGRRSSR